MLVNSNYTVGQYFLASSIINSGFKRKTNKNILFSTILIVTLMREIFGKNLKQVFLNIL